MDDVFETPEIKELRSQLVSERKRRYAVEEKLKKLIITIQKSGGVRVPDIFRVEADTDHEARDDFLDALHDDLGDRTHKADDLDDEFDISLQESEIKFEEDLNLSTIVDIPTEDTSKTHMSAEEEKRFKNKIQKLEEEINLFQERTSHQTQVELQAKQTIASLEADVELSSQHIKKLITKLNQRSDQLSILLQVNSDLKIQSQRYESLVFQNSDLNAKIVSMELQIKESQTQLALKDQSIKEREESIVELKKKLEGTEQTVEKMATGLLKLKSRLAKFEQELCKFTVEKTYKAHPSSTAQLILIENMSQRRKHIDVIVNGKRHTYPLKTIFSISASKTDANKFYIVLKDKTQEAFSSSVRDEVVMTLQDHLDSEK